MSKNLKKNRQVAQPIGIDMNAVEDFMNQRGSFRIIEVIAEAGQRAAQIVKNIPNFARKGGSIFSTKGAEIGTGLGRSVSYFIVVENHGGTMDVESSLTPLVICLIARHGVPWANVTRSGHPIRSHFTQRCLLKNDYDNLRL